MLFTFSFRIFLMVLIMLTERTTCNDGYLFLSCFRDVDNANSENN